MKVLTIFATLFAPLTFITGYYGMNFDNIPLLHHEYGWAISTVVMLLVAASMAAFFKARRWL